MEITRRSCGKCIYWSTNHNEHKRCKSCGEGRNNFVSRDMKCPVASCQAGMIYYAKDVYLECPDCGTQIWPFAMEKSDKSVIRQESEKHLPCDRNKGVSSVVMHTKGVKSSSKSKGARKGMEKKSTSQINKELAI